MSKVKRISNPNNPKYYANQITFLARESELGKNLTSKFLKVIAESGKLGITRKGIATVMKSRKQIKDIKELNFAFDGMQKKNLIRKEQRRNGKYFLSAKGSHEYQEKLAPVFKKQAAAIKKQQASKKNAA